VFGGCAGSDVHPDVPFGDHWSWNSVSSVELSIQASVTVLFVAVIAPPFQAGCTGGLVGVAGVVTDVDGALKPEFADVPSALTW
jgi:hypothetical protein